MIVNWLLRLLIPHWEDLILNPVTGKASSKSMFAAIGFMVGIWLSILSVKADIDAGRPVEKTAIMLLLANGLGLAAMKIWSQQANRETATPEGMPLTKPGTDPPEPMPQPFNPNAPENRPLAGYNDYPRNGQGPSGE